MYLMLARNPPYRIAKKHPLHPALKSYVSPFAHARILCNFE